MRLRSLSTSLSFLKDRRDSATGDAGPKLNEAREESGTWPFLGDSGGDESKVGGYCLVDFLGDY